MRPNLYDAVWIQLVYELSHAVKDKFQVTYSDDDDDDDDDDDYYDCSEVCHPRCVFKL